MTTLTEGREKMAGYKKRKNSTVLSLMQLNSTAQDIQCAGKVLLALMEVRLDYSNMSLTNIISYSCL